MILVVTVAGWGSIPKYIPVNKQLAPENGGWQTPILAFWNKGGLFSEVFSLVTRERISANKVLEDSPHRIQVDPGSSYKWGEIMSVTNL